MSFHNFIAVPLFSLTCDADEGESNEERDPKLWKQYEFQNFQFLGVSL